MLNKRFIGSQLALVLGTSGMLGGITAISSGGSTGGLFTGETFSRPRTPRPGNGKSP